MDRSAASEPASPSPSSSIAPLDRTEGARRQRHQRSARPRAAARAARRPGPGDLAGLVERAPAWRRSAPRPTTQVQASMRRWLSATTAGSLISSTVEPISSWTSPPGAARHVLLPDQSTPATPSRSGRRRPDEQDRPSSRSMTQAAPTVNEEATSRTIQRRHRRHSPPDQQEGPHHVPAPGQASAVTFRQVPTARRGPAHQRVEQFRRSAATGVRRAARSRTFRSRPTSATTAPSSTHAARRPGSPMRRAPTGCWRRRSRRAFPSATAHRSRATAPQRPELPPPSDSGSSPEMPPTTASASAVHPVGTSDA